MTQETNGGRISFENSLSFLLENVKDAICIVYDFF